MKRRKMYIFIGSFILLCGCIVSIFMVKKLLEHENWQTEQLAILLDENAKRREEIVSINDEMGALSEDNKSLQDKLLTLENEIKTSEITYEPESYNYLAIGNSITKHPKCDYWWSEIGMAASSEEKDFVHLVSAYLSKQYEKQTTYAVCYAIWEMQVNDRAETYEVIDPYLSTELDLITIQLGENVSGLSTFESDFEELIAYVQFKCPKAEIIIIDDFWENSKRRELKLAVVERLGLPFADLSEIVNKPEYRSEMGAIVYGDDGKSHVVEHSGVAIHPGDAGMQYIADKVIELIGLF